MNYWFNMFLNEPSIIMIFLAENMVSFGWIFFLQHFLQKEDIMKFCTQNFFLKEVVKKCMCIHMLKILFYSAKLKKKIQILECEQEKPFW
jgi:hypothetical protein